MEENRKEHRIKSFFRKVRQHAKRLLLVGNILVVLWLWLCCAITWIPCDSHPYLSLVTFTFPVALLFNLLFVGVWVFVRVRWVWMPLCSTLVCWGYILDYCPINGDSSTEIPPTALKVVSWNTKYFGKHEGKDDKARMYVKNLDADIICLQESITTGPEWEEFLDSMAQKGYEHHHEKGLTLFTRFHIIATDTIVYDTRSNGSRWYQLARGGDTVLVVNNHLESNHISGQIKEEYGHALDQPEYSRVKESGRSLLPLVATSARYRGSQTRALSRFVSAHEGEHIILCGDFNDTPISYAYQTLSRQMTNVFRESGSGVGLTYDEKGFWVRIDHIFYAAGGRSYAAYVDRTIATSDHFPIVSWVDFKQNQQ